MIHLRLNLETCLGVYTVCFDINFTRPGQTTGFEIQFKIVHSLLFPLLIQLYVNSYINGN